MNNQKTESYNIEDMGLKELVDLKTKLSEMIHDRQLVEENTVVSREYRADTRLYMAQLSAVLKGIDLRYDEMTMVDSLGYEFGESILLREEAKLILDEETGKPIVNKLKTKVEVFDDHLLDGGIEYGSTFMLAGQSNAGKSEVVYMIMRGALEQKIKVHFHSYEIRKASFYRNFSKDVKNKFKLDLHDEEYSKLLSVDYLAMDIKQLEQMIRQRHVDGCEVFVLDSLTKVLVDGKYATGNDESLIVSDTLRKLAHGLGIIIIILGQKDKRSKIENANELFGSIMQEHIFDYILFIGYEDIDNIATDEREIVMTKNRGDETKEAVITAYDKENNKIVFKKSSVSIGRKSNWMDRLR